MKMWLYSMDSSDKGTTIVLIGNFSDPMILQNFSKSLIVVLFKNLIWLLKISLSSSTKLKPLKTMLDCRYTEKGPLNGKGTHASLYNDGYIWWFIM